MDINRLRDGTYSSSVRTIPRDDIRSKPRPTSSTKVATEKDGYECIPFRGCGMVLLDQRPDGKIVSSKAENEATTRHHRQGGTGVSLWSASFVISYYIDAQWSEGGSWNLASEPNWTVLELGAGLGMCSAVAVKHRMNVVATDNDPAVLALLKDNLQRNRLQTTSSAQTQSTHVHSLDWMAVANDPRADRSHPVFLQLEALGGADLILLSDVVYGATQPAWQALLTLLNKVCAQRRRLGPPNTNSFALDGMENPLVLLGYTQRRRDVSAQEEARFFGMVQAAGMEAVLIPATRVPHGEKYLLTWRKIPVDFLVPITLGRVDYPCFRARCASTINPAGRQT